MAQNDNLLPGLGSKPPSMDQVRREGFKNAIPDFCKICRKFSVSAKITVPQQPDSRKIAMEMFADPKFQDNVVELMAAIFAVRLIASRSAMETGPREFARRYGIELPESEVERFYKRAVERLDALQLEKFRGFEIAGGPIEARAVSAYMTGAAYTALQAFHDELTRDEAKNVHLVDEAEFWKALFLGIADNDEGNCVARGFGVIYLDHARDFAQAVADDCASAVRSTFRVVEPA